MLQTFNEVIATLSDIVWGPVMLILILGTGLYLSIGLKGFTIKQLPEGFRQLWRGRRSDEEGEVPPFNALMIALSATIGTGNIVGVATAIALGGPGALFWMWLTALVGMATKYAEAVLAVHYRKTNEYGEHVGGPMYYIRYGLGENWRWLAAAFAFFGMIAAFGIGNTVQGNSVAQAMSDLLVPDATGSALTSNKLATGLVLMALVAAVILGGIRRIGHIAGGLVPFMGIAYFACGLFVVLTQIHLLPDAFTLIVKSAFTGTAATGGFAGAAVMAAIRFGVARGIFSNEAGLGSAPMAHAHARTNSPVKQGTIAMLGTFIDTIIVCSITGLAIVMTGVWTSGETGSTLTSMAMETGLPGFGQYIVSASIALFALTTLIGWSVYGERCTCYLFGDRARTPFRILWIIAIPIGAIANLELIWAVADVFNALMAIPNLIALVLLSPVVFQLTRTALAKNPV